MDQNIIHGETELVGGKSERAIIPIQIAPTDQEETGSQQYGCLSEPLDEIKKSVCLRYLL
jgi:hypothetical protein